MFSNTQWNQIKDEAWEKAQIEGQKPSPLSDWNIILMEDLIEKKGRKFVCNSFMKSEHVQYLESMLKVMKSKENQSNNQGLIKKRKY